MINEYNCDRCGLEHVPDESKIMNKQEYIKPHSCYGGDYYVDLYFWLKCDCGRGIKIKEEHLTNPHTIVKDYSEHEGVC